MKTFHYNPILVVALIIANARAFSITLPSRSPLSREVAKKSSTFVLSSSSPSDGDDIPSMDWLTNGLSTTTGDGVTEEKGDENVLDKVYIEDHDPDAVMGEQDAPIPSTGLSVSDEMRKAQREGFISEVVKIKGLKPGIQAAQIVTTATISANIEPVRYLIGISPHAVKKNETSGEWDLAEDDDTVKSFVMVDIPPYSPTLEHEMRQFMGKTGKLAAILITSKDCIHYDEAPGVYTVRKSHLQQWSRIFPDTPTVAYRMDIPRDCREFISQRLDGYGPFAFQEGDESEEGVAPFVETGKPLTYEEWDYDVAQGIFAGKIAIPDDDVNATTAQAGAAEEDDDEHSPEAIRSREEGKRILAVCTPGRTYGSLSYVFPEVQLVASGWTIPAEDSRLGDEGTVGMGGSTDSPGPRLDVRGYVTTSKAGMARQMESARNLVESYADRFDVILPSESDPYYVDRTTVEERKEELFTVFDQYEKIGMVYERLGITSF